MSGQMLQTGDPREIFSLPQNKDIARFVGVDNILEGLIASNEEGIVTIDIGGNTIEAVSNLDPGDEVCACIRPEEVSLALSKTATSARNSFSGKITGMVTFGPLARVEVDCGFPLVALVTRRSAEELDLRIGNRIYASFKATGVHIIRR